jgi:hypothetical protein
MVGVPSTTGQLGNVLFLEYPISRDDAEISRAVIDFAALMSMASSQQAGYLPKKKNYQFPLTTAVFVVYLNR